MPKKIFFFFLLMSFFIQPVLPAGPDFNPPYPRIGQIYFYMSGAGPEIWKDHGLVMIRHYFPADAKRIKTRNPNVVLMAANDMLEGGGIKGITKKGLPEEWFLHDGTGNRAGFWAGFITNLTSMCPKNDYFYGNQNFNQFAVEFLYQNTDWNYFDGTVFDTWYGSLAYRVSDLGDIDLDYDGVPEGAATVNSQWSAGQEKLVRDLRARSNNYPVIAHEAGDLYFNGNGFEFWTGEENPAAIHDWNMGVVLKLQANGVSPVLNYANSEVSGYGASWRADFTSAQIVGAFSGHDEGTFAHRWTYLHDEYEAKLGNALGAGTKLSGGLWVRYFENGAIISNVSGGGQSVTSAQLSGGPYYRFQGSQDPNFNNGQPFTSVSFEAMDGILLLKKRDTLITPIIIDNEKNNMTSIDQSRVKYTGTWSRVDFASGSTQAYGLMVGWGDNITLYATASSGQGEAKAIYQPHIKVPGVYEVSVWYPPGQTENWATNANYKIVSADGEKVVTVDQNIYTGQWYRLGNFKFNLGQGGYVELSNDADGPVVADAVRFSFGAFQGTSSGSLTTPTGLGANLGPDRVELAWNQSNNANIIGYNVYRSTTSGSGFQPVGSSLSNEYWDFGMPGNVNYFYKIQAYDAGFLLSPFSSEVEIFFAPASQPPCTLEVENFSSKSAGLDNGDHWFFNVAGEAVQSVFFPGSGEYQFVILARGDPGGGWPIARLSIDKNPVDSVEVSSGVWKQYEMRAVISQGTHNISLAFTEDWWGPDYGTVGDRNLYLDNVSIMCAQSECQSSIITAGLETPLSSFELSNEPNPFNPITNIYFAVPNQQKASLSIFNVHGQIIRKLFAGEMTAGRHVEIWDGKDEQGELQASGIYYYQLQTKTKILNRRLILMK